MKLKIEIVEKNITRKSKIVRNLKDFLKSKGFSQTEFAKRFGYTCANVSLVSKGKRSLTIKMKKDLESL